MCLCVCVCASRFPPPLNSTASMLDLASSFRLLGEQSFVAHMRRQRDQLQDFVAGTASFDQVCRRTLARCMLCVSVWVWRGLMCNFLHRSTADEPRLLCGCRACGQSTAIPPHAAQWKLGRHPSFTRASQLCYVCPDVYGVLVRTLRDVTSLLLADLRP